MITVLIPLPNYGFDPTEAAIPWKFLTDNNIDVVFTTPEGKKATTDSIVLTGDRLGLLASSLRARQDAVEAYYEMTQSKAFCRPMKYSDAVELSFEAILLPGGHDKEIKEYLESKELQTLVVDFFKANKPVAAVCHGVLLVARSIDPATNKSVIYDYKTTSLLKSQERLAYQLTRLWLDDYYLTYPHITVEDEVRGQLCSEKNFIRGPMPLSRDTQKHQKRGFVVKDRNYLTARWPGDIYRFSNEFLNMLSEKYN